MSSKLESDVCYRVRVALSGNQGGTTCISKLQRQLQAWRKVMAAYRQVYGVIHFTYLQADCLYTRNHLRAQRSVTSMEKLSLYLLRFTLDLRSLQNTNRKPHFKLL